MTENLAGTDDLPLSDQAFAAAQRQAGIRLAGIALTITKGDRKAAAKALLEPLVAIGLLPYKPGAGNWHYGAAS